MLRGCCLVLVSLWLAGCAARQQDIAADSPPRLHGTGVVLGSVTSLADQTRSPPWQESSSYFFRSTDNPEVTGVVRSGGSNNLSGWDEQPCAADGLEQACGRLFALELPAGTYQITAVQVNNLGSRHAIYPAAAYSRLLENVYFTVQAGELRYLGNLESRVCVGAAGSYGNLEVWAVRGEVRDEHARDWPLLTNKFPWLQGLAITPAVIQTQPWLWMRPKPAPADQWPAECGPYPDGTGP